MAIYRVTFHIDLLVDCETEREAERIAYNNLENEIRNCSLGAVPWSIRRVESTDNLRRGEQGSLPWRDPQRYEEPELTVDELLGGK
jgi:hypothetical protein